MQWRVDNDNYWSFTEDETDGRFHIFTENKKWILEDWKDKDEPQEEYQRDTLEECKSLVEDILNK